MCVSVGRPACWWCRHADLAAELEITKAVTFLKMKEFSKAVKALEAFEKSDSRMCGTVLNTLCVPASCWPMRHRPHVVHVRMYAAVVR